MFSGYVALIIMQPHMKHNGRQNRNPFLSDVRKGSLYSEHSWYLDYIYYC
jgi:hypothetical protein